MAAAAANLAALGGSHTAGIFSDMTLDGPVIGALVVIMDRARNLPSRRSMGKQDPYVAARLGKEAKKTKTDKRGGQTPRWDEELRFTVHDSPDYHRIKVSLFNDDRKTELIGETWINVESVIAPGGGPSDDWHGLICKGKYAGEIHCKFTFYDNRVKAEKPVSEKTRQSGRSDGQSPALRGPRESKPVKRRPLPSDPTAASPSAITTPEHRKPKGIVGGPRTLGTPRSQQAPEPQKQQQPQQWIQQDPVDTPQRRPLPDASPLNGTPVSNQHTPQPRQQPKDPYSTPPNPRSSNPNIPMTREESFDMSYAAPKPYVQALSTSNRRDSSHRTMSQDDFRSSQGHLQQPPPEPIHSHSAPSVPTQQNYEHESHQESYDHHNGDYSQDRSHSYSHDLYQDPAYQVAPLRTSRSREHAQEQPSISNPYLNQRYIEAPPQHDLGSARRRSAMQPMVEDEPPMPPVHRKNASTLPHPHQEDSHHYHNEPSELMRYSEEPNHIDYEQHSQHSQQYMSNDYEHHQSSERRMTYSHATEHSSSQAMSREVMAPTSLRQEAPALPLSLIPGPSPVRQEREAPAYQAQAPPAYENPPRLRHYSEPAEYRAITQYENPVESQALVHHSSFRHNDYDYPHDPPEQPRRTSPVYDPAPIVKPRATSPGLNPSPRHSPNPYSDRNSPNPYSDRISPNPYGDRTSPNPYSDRTSPNPYADRNARGPSRSMPTRKSVSPRPPPFAEDSGERRLSGVAFDPDSFDVYNPRASKSPVPGTSDDERPGSSLEYNDKGQIVTFTGRVVEASDHLPVDSWAPEPTPKGTVKERPSRQRAQLYGSRDLQSAAEREEKYRQERAQRERMRQAASETFDTPSNALVTTRHDFSAQDSSQDYSGALVLAGSARNRLQKRLSAQNYELSSQHNSPDSHVLRERQNTNSYGSSPSYDRASRSGEYIGGRAPPIPAKIPLDTRAGDGGYPASQEDLALSLELQSIDIGPGSGGRRPRAQPRRNYGF